MDTHKQPLVNERGAVAIEYSMKLCLLCLGLLVGTTQIGTSAETTFYTVGTAMQGNSFAPLMSGGATQTPGYSGGGTEQEFEVSAEDGVDEPEVGPSNANPVPLP